MDTKRSMAVCVVAALSCGPVLAQDAATFEIRSMTPEIALAAAQAAQKACRDAGYQVSVAVVDRAGLLQVLLRDRFAGAHTVGYATDKAWTAASFKTSTAELRAFTEAGRPEAGIRHVARVATVGGGLPIGAAGTHLGGIGVSGAPGGEADQGCAQAGIDAVEADLSF